MGYNDADFCCKVSAAGYSVTFTPYAKLYHNEFVSRGREEGDPSKMQRWLRERALMQEKWPQFFEQGDPFSNPNLDRDSLAGGRAPLTAEDLFRGFEDGLADAVRLRCAQFLDFAPSAQCIVLLLFHAPIRFPEQEELEIVGVVAQQVAHLVVTRPFSSRRGRVRRIRAAASRDAAPRRRRGLSDCRGYRAPTRPPSS